MIYYVYGPILLIDLSIDNLPWCRVEDRRDATRELCAEWGRDGHFSAAALDALGAKEARR